MHTKITIRLDRSIINLENDGATFKVSFPTAAVQLYIDTLSGTNLVRAIRARVMEHISGVRAIEGARVWMDEMERISKA